MERCELCSQECAVHCDADCADLCWECDEKVHETNFLVARHARTVLCCKCHQHTQTTICGSCPNAVPALSLLICTACFNSSAQSAIFSTSQNQKDCRSAQGNAGCISTDERSHVTTSLITHRADEAKRQAKTRHARAGMVKMQRMLIRWCRYLNLRSSSTVPLAMHLVEKGLTTHKLGGCFFSQKLRMYLVGALWLAASLCENEGCLPCVKRVEECTGIPSKFIVRVATSLDWKMHPHQSPPQEGWADSSC